MSADIIALLLSNFPLSMFVLALILIAINRLVSKKISSAEIIYRWISLFPLGFTAIYAFVMHAFYPEFTAATIGWASSPFQYEVAMADLGFGAIAILSFRANYGFRLATVIANTFWLWGDAIGHIYQMISQQNYSVGNAGSWFWMDIIIPLLLLITMCKLKKYEK